MGEPTAFDSAVASVAQQFVTVWEAPVPFAIILAIVSLAIWRAMEWRYGGAIEILKDRLSHLEVKPGSGAQVIPTAPTPSVFPPAATQLANTIPHAIEEGGRIFLAPNTDPIDLMEMHEGKTNMHSQKAAEPYKGKWIRFRGKVSEVSRLTDGLASVWFTPKSLHNIVAYISNTAVAEALHIGDEIEIIGQIDVIRRFGVELTDAEIVARY